MCNTSIPTTQDGQTLYCYRQVSVGVDKGAVHEHGVAKKAKLSGAQADALADMFHSIGWKFNVKTADKIVPGQKFPKAFSDLLQQAVEASERLCRDCMKLMHKFHGLPLQHVLLFPCVSPGV